ncbi:MAG: peptide chain release factor N(5)-glutamine methyltransferase [Clostridiales bacterium]|nr:peptide chain release factor N(5)-glutamine methyltransferase [Clostridiales bacterium]
MNTRMILRLAAGELEAAGVPDPEYDSAVLLSSVTGIPPLELRMGLNEEPGEAQMVKFRELIERRKQREPLQYIEGRTVFRGRAYTVRPGVLIPRPETALLSVWAEERLKGLEKESAVLDLCCGSGCLGISLKLEMSRIRCVLTDLSPEAAALSRENAEALGADCEILRGDLFGPVRDRKFDLIVSNPPYIPTEEYTCLQAEVLREPRMALDGGEDGMDFYRRIAAEAPAYLNSGGALMMELGIREAEPVRRMLTEHGAKRTEIRRDFSGTERMILAEYA